MPKPQPMRRRLAGRGCAPANAAGRVRNLIPQHFPRLGGDARAREMLCLADWLIKPLSGGGGRIIQRPAGNHQEVHYKQRK